MTDRSQDFIDPKTLNKRGPKAPENTISQDTELLRSWVTEPLGHLQASYACSGGSWGGGGLRGGD